MAAATMMHVPQVQARITSSARQAQQTPQVGGATRNCDVPGACNTG